MGDKVELKLTQGPVAAFNVDKITLAAGAGTGAAGTNGTNGTNGVGVPAGGSENDGVRKQSGTDYDFGILKHNLSATIAPTTAENLGDGYTEGSLWFDVSAVKAYICLVSTTEASYWLDITLASLKTILGQYDTRPDSTATNGSTKTLDYSLGNAFKIDASAMGAGESFTITMSNLPAGAAYSAWSVLIVTGANLPTVSYTALDADVAAPILVASKDNEIIGRTWDNGSKVVYTLGESF